MALDQNLMGLGMPAALAARIASGGTGPVSITPKGSSFSTAAQISGKQFITYIGTGTGWVNLPAVGGSDMAPEIADDFVTHNGSGGNITIGIASGVTVNIGGTAYTGSYTLANLKTLQLWVQSATQWFGLSN